MSAGIIQSTGEFLRFLEMLRQENLIQVLAEPRLVTRSGRSASFFVGREEAVPTSDGRAFVENNGLRLNFAPTVLRDGKVRMEVEPEFARSDAAHSVTIDGTRIPGRVVDRINTTAELKTGQTFFLIGWPAPQPEAKEAELVLLVTPRINSPVPCEETSEAYPTVSKQHDKGDEGASGKEANERLRRMERRLKRLREEVDDLRRELRSLSSTSLAPSGG